jgi:branched-chain amino acid transport system substrate-binding protein
VTKRVGSTGLIAVAMALALLAAACGSSKTATGSSSTTAAGGGTVGTAPAGNTASAPGITPTRIKVGYIYEATGQGSSSEIGGDGGARARFALQNAAGGVNGRMIDMTTADTQTNPQAFSTAANDMVQNQHVFGILPISSLTFLGAAALNKQGIPLVGSAFDGPEWGEQPYNNMFTFTIPLTSTINGSDYTYTYFGKLLKQIAVSKFGGLAYGISQSSQQSVKAAVASATKQGIATCYTNYAVPFGAVDFTAAALSIKSTGCNGVVGALVDSSNSALAQTLQDSGSKAKLLFFQGYDQSVLDSSSARSSLNGAYFTTSVIFYPSSPPVKTMLDAMVKYGGLKPGAIPDFGMWTSYVAADMFIKGLELAGQNPTRQSFITNLRKVTSYDAGGLLATPANPSAFGTINEFPATACGLFVQLQGNKFVPAPDDGKVCGDRIAYKP